MKKAIYILLFTVILTGVIAGKYFYSSLNYIETHQSPDGNYELIIQRDSIVTFSTMPGDGDIGSRSAEVILKSADGKVIGTTNRNKRCRTILDSIEVDWDFENHWVWYARGKTIDLKTGEFDC